MMTPTVWHQRVSSVFRDDGIRKKRASAKRGTRKKLSTVAPEIQLGVRSTAPLGDHRRAGRGHIHNLELIRR